MYRRLVLATTVFVSWSALGYEAAPYTPDATRKLERASQYVEAPSTQNKNHKQSFADMLTYYSALYERAGYDFPKSFARFVQFTADNDGERDMRPEARHLFLMFALVEDLKSEGTSIDAIFQGKAYAPVRDAYAAANRALEKRKKAQEAVDQKRLEEARVKSERDRAYLLQKQAEAEEQKAKEKENEAAARKASTEARERQAAEAKTASEQRQAEKRAKFKADMDAFNSRDAAAKADLKQRNDANLSKTLSDSKASTAADLVGQVVESTGDDAKTDDKTSPPNGKEAKPADKDNKAADTVKKLFKIFGK